MSEYGIPSPQDITTVCKAASGITGAIQRLMPGISMRSIQKAESRNTQLILDDLEKIKERKEQLGLSDTFVEELQHDAIKRHRRAVNLANVLSYAESGISETANIDNVDDDWLEEFQDHAEKASDKDAQIIWGKLLAGEMNSPGSYSKQLMSTLSIMSRSDAEMFLKLTSFCIFCIESHGKTTRQVALLLHLDSDKDNTYNLEEYNYNMLSRLASFGLLDLSGFTRFIVEPSNRISFLVNDDVITLNNETEEEKHIVFQYVFTPVGAELASLCETAKFDRLNDIFISKMTDNELTFDHVEAN